MMFDFIRKIFKKKKITVVCARVGESLAPPIGSVVDNCDCCDKKVTVAPLSFKILKNKNSRILCVQCNEK